jgi:hypothetical protein
MFVQQGRLGHRGAGTRKAAMYKKSRLAQLKHKKRKARLKAKDKALKAQRVTK